jgi:hypothetical protein
VTRLGEFSPNWWLLTLGSYIKITEIAYIFGLLCCTVKFMHYIIVTKMGCATYWAIFSQTRLVILAAGAEFWAWVSNGWFRRFIAVNPTHVHTYMCTFSHTYICTYIHTCVYSCMCTYMHVYIHTYVHTCVHSYMCTFIHVYIHTCVHSYICTNVHTCVDTYVFLTLI